MNKDASIVEVVYYNRRFIIIVMTILLASLFLGIDKLTGPEWVNIVMIAIGAYSATYFKTGGAGQQME